MHPTPVATEPAFAQIDWGEDGIPRSPQYADVFHSTAGAAGQCEHVFIRGNRLPQRWPQCRRFAIGELGFGSGLNFLLTADAWLAQAGPQQTLHYCGIEQHPWTPADTTRLFKWLNARPALLQEWLQCLSALRIGANRFVLGQGRIHLTLHVGDVAEVLPRMQGWMDAWYLDGFNPRTNGAMWAPEIYRCLFAQSRGGTTLASWCCAGHVRRALGEAGFAVQKQAGYAHKREMLSACKPGAAASRARHERVQIIGAGLAGAWLAHELAERDIQVEVYERANGPGRGASGMPMLVIRPFARHRDTPTARFFWQAAPLAVRRTAALGLNSWVETPVWRAFADENPHWLQPAGWCDGQELCTRLLAHPAIRCFYGRDIPGADGWACRREPTFFCTADAPGIALGARNVIRGIRGQQSLWRSSQGQLGDMTPRVGDCVAAQAEEGLYFGATHRYDDEDIAVYPEEALGYGRNLPVPPTSKDLAQMSHWAATRRQSRDRLPCCGPAPEADSHWARSREAGKAQVADIPAQPQVWLNLAHGSRGATSAVLAAVLLADQIEELPAPVLADEATALDPRRFILREWRRGNYPPPR